MLSLFGHPFGVICEAWVKVSYEIKVAGIIFLSSKIQNAMKTMAFHNNIVGAS